MTETEFLSPSGTLTLTRFPIRPNDKLRAWDAADELLMNHLDEQQLIQADRKILIFNDQFGAITTAVWQMASVAKINVTLHVMTDSFISQSAIQKNCEQNNLNTECVDIDYVDITAIPDEDYDLILYKLPRNLSFFTDVLVGLRNCMTESSVIIGGAMVKYLPASAIEHLNKTVGPTETSRAAKKARLLFSRLDEALEPIVPRTTSYAVEELGGDLVNYSNVFSRDSLDMGTRLLLPVIPRTEGAVKIADLACGNGVIGLVAAKLNPDAELVFCDESAMAVKSAAENFEKYCYGQYGTFMQTDCLDGVERNSLDYVICNPPFHQQNTVSEHIGWQMFKESLECLVSGGVLLIVGNRHLGYHLKIKKLFGNATVVASDSKFVVVRAVKR